MGLNSYRALFILTSLMLTSCIAADDTRKGVPSKDDIQAASTSPSPSKAVSQRLQCDFGDDFCPEFASEESWKYFTDQCCPENSGLTFHAQRTEAKGCILACLPVSKCQPGEIPILYKNSEIDSVFIKCRPCQNNTFERKPLDSYKYRDPTCRGRHQICRDRKVLQRKGNATHDATCRCLWEKGFAPHPNTSECTNPEGFDGNTLCYCVSARHYCPENMQLNHEYKCVPQLSSTESTTHKEDYTTSPRTITHKPLVDVDDTAQPVYNFLAGEPERWIYIAAWVLFILGCAIYLAFRFHP